MTDSIDNLQLITQKYLTVKDLKLLLPTDANF